MLSFILTMVAYGQLTQKDAALMPPNNPSLLLGPKLRKFIEGSTLLPKGPLSTITHYYRFSLNDNTMTQGSDYPIDGHYKIDNSTVCYTTSFKERCFEVAKDNSATYFMRFTDDKMRVWTPFGIRRP